MIKRNVAKCRLCSSVVESFHSDDYVECKCGEIAVDKGEALVCYAKDFKNFIRIDHEGNEITVKISALQSQSQSEHKQPGESTQEIPLHPPLRSDLVKEIQHMIDTIEALPQHAMSSNLTHYDYLSLLFLLLSLFKLPPETDLPS